MQLLDSYKTELALLKQFIEEEEKRGETEKVAKALAEVFRNKGKALICGNGGSNCDAMHFAEEFTGRFRKERPALPAISLSDSSHITCVDRKSTRLNSSHANISYAVFCLKKKKHNYHII